MRTLPLLEALFRFDDRRVALEICASAQSVQERVECLSRFYPHGMSAEGAVILKVVAAALLLGVLCGIGTVIARLWPLFREGKEPFTMPPAAIALRLAIWTAMEARNGMWIAWKILMGCAFIILLVQILVA